VHTSVTLKSAQCRYRRAAGAQTLNLNPKSSLRAVAHFNLPSTRLSMNEMSHPAFTPQPQRITALWPVLISRPTEGMRLSWPGWLVTYRDGMPAQRRAINRSIVGRPGIELTTTESQVRHPSHLDYRATLSVKCTV